MSFRAELRIDGHEAYRVLNCEHTLSRPMGMKSFPSGPPEFGRIELHIESTEDIFFWSKIGVPDSEYFKGEIVFLARDEEITLKKLMFTDALVVNHTEHFAEGGSDPMTISMTITARALTMSTNASEATIENNWADA